MNFNFSDSTRRAMKRAREIAHAYGQEQVAPEHITLAILKDADAAVQLRELVKDPVTLREALEARMERGDSMVSMGELPFSRGAKRTLEFTMATHRDLRRDIIVPLHILVGVLREGANVAAEVMKEFGLTEERLMGQDGSGSVARADLLFTIDDSSDVSIYEQIVLQITEAIATGAVEEGERLPTVRRLADHLDIAPGTVAKAYAELERQGLVITEGARGTRVAGRRSAAPRADIVPQLSGLLRPVAVAAFHLGAGADDLRLALEEALTGIFDEGGRKA